ncbi:uncharacterized protein PV06_06782 [Exophiala oligosperma]|uniref:Uncharacterized protein n=2 Tax=Chaetothyriales TaxID=34395 RepID=A0A0D2DFK7_9EURO|nr:uncharacterized protein PV06_06782 [Exophiala oligosperma]KAJ9633422.1 hypothetical protein H2204_006972 [Knufia peltigerae]KIW41205.1 hypothetical protein PV06_06782 [Exophiala oligosperma]
MALSTHFALPYISYAFGTIFLGFGINAIVRPAHGLTFFEMSPPKDPASAKVVNALMVVYGVRDIFMGLAIYAATYYGAREVLGCILISVFLVAAVDGWVCLHFVGHGQNNHWSYAPMLAAVGAVLLGFADHSS